MKNKSYYKGDNDSQHDDDYGDDRNNNSSSRGDKASVSEERDEVAEVLKLAKTESETKGVRILRGAVTFLLIVTGSVVCSVSFVLLQREQTRNFEAAFEKFSRTLADAAVSQQADIRHGLASLADIITGFAADDNAANDGDSWPFVRVPGLARHALNTRQASALETIALSYVVDLTDVDAYLNWTAQHYQTAVKEANMIEYGSLEFLYDDPTQFVPTVQDSGDTPPNDYYMLWWDYSPPYEWYGSINVNVRAFPGFDAQIQAAMTLKNETIYTDVQEYQFPPRNHEEMHDVNLESSADHPHTFYCHPVLRSFSANNDAAAAEVVAILHGAFAWDAGLRNLLPDNVKGLVAIIKNDCNQAYTYEIEGKNAFYKGEGDLHDTKYNGMEMVVDLSLHANPQTKDTNGHCSYSMHLYPSRDFEDTHRTVTPIIFVVIVAATFLLMILTFYLYDLFVQRRNMKIVQTAARSNAVVTSMFPTMVRDRLFAQQEANMRTKKTGTKQQMTKFLNDNDGIAIDFDSKPIADLFLETTIMFADIVGFTAWSSVREPTQVFQLLEAIFKTFDKIAKESRIYKVETVGDCYVAIAGLPEARKDHAVAMARFARKCMKATHQVTQKLEVLLGPDTGDLDVRIGIHSGPITAGVLRGDRSRFQLFGDTMNTTARIESTGIAGKIQVSSTTAALLTAVGKGSWMVPRDTLVSAKGKGDIQTYWLRLKGEETGSVSNSDPSESSLVETPDMAGDGSGEEKRNRLVDWNCEQLTILLKQVVARRRVLAGKHYSKEKVDEKKIPSGDTVLSEVKEIIFLPEFSHEMAIKEESDMSKIELDEDVVYQLHEYVTCISTMYRNNPFHNFEHASHVVMSVMKLMSRIVAPAELGLDETDEGDLGLAATMHDHTYGITSDPITAFACALSALVHDVDHRGVTNMMLINEDPKLAAAYNNRSVAEQNSFDLAWDLLMDDAFAALRGVLYSNQEEFVRFRQLMVNVVMATDIMDKGLKDLRNKRWATAFPDASKPLPESSPATESPRESVNRKATIVLEHLIQASDVAHTMQHWHVYRKWNERLLREMYNAYLKGHSPNDPTENWYKGEIGFFDFYIIPLAKKLKECGVFGKSSDEYLGYAQQNRKEWEAQGQQVVAEVCQRLKQNK